MSNFFPETLGHCSLPLAPGENHLGTPRGCGDPKNNRLYLGKRPLEDSVLSSPCPNLPTVFHPNPSPIQVLVLPKSVGPREGNGGPCAMSIHSNPFRRAPRPHRSRAANVEAGSPSSPKPSKIPLLPPPRPFPRPPPAGFVQRRQRGKKDQGKRRGGSHVGRGQPG